MLEKALKVSCKFTQVTTTVSGICQVLSY